MAEVTTSIGDILFVLGAPRSGTSLTSRLLLDYFDYGMGPEGQWIVPMSRRAPSYGDLGVDENARRLIRDILEQNMFQIVDEQYSERFGWPVQVTEAKVWAAVRHRSFAGIAYAALSCLAIELRRTRVGSKDPSFARDLDTLDRLFPHARYLSIVRDGRDVALSMMQQPWGQKSWYANARLWADTHARIQAFRDRTPDARFLEIRYEDLLRMPAQTCEAMERFLEIRLPPERRAAFVEEISGGSRSRNYEKWKSRMTPRDHRLYEAAAGLCLERHGYERVAPGARARSWERAWYLGSEYARRAWRKARMTLGLPVGDAPLPPRPPRAGSGSGETNTLET